MRLLPLTVPLLFLPFALAGTAGPDGGGVVYTDSAEALGPSHTWLDAADGDAHALADDETVTVNLPFDFRFYGVDHATATISSNGVLFFSGATSSPTGVCPGTTTDWSGIAAYWDDLAASTVHTATYGTYPWRTFVVSWDGVAHARAGGEGRFQIWLLEGRNEAVVVLDDTTWGDRTYDVGATAAIGTNSATGGLAWSCSTPYPDASTVWFGDADDRPARAQVSTEDLDAPWTGIGDFDYSGRALAAGDVNGDGTEDLLVGTQDRVQGAVALVYRPGIGDDLSVADATFTGEVNGDAFGTAVLADDLDGDGQDEILVGAPGYDVGTASRAGRVYLWEGGGLSGSVAAATADATWTGLSTGAPAAGTTLATGDLDGDGYRDLVVGSPTADTGGNDAGAVYIVYGTGLPSGAAALSAADATVLGVDPSDQLGGALATGDLDADGADELVISALFADDGASNAGTVYVLAGGTRAAVEDVDIAATCSFSTSGSSARLGASLLLADIDGSGAIDLFVGGPTEDGTRSDAGKAYGVYDPGLACLAAASLADAVVTGTSTAANVGSTLAAGDLDGDGTDDLVIGAPNMNLLTSGGGAAYVFTTAPIGAVDASAAAHAIAGHGSGAALTTGLVVAGNAVGSPSLIASAPFESVKWSSEGTIYPWRYTPDFLDADADGFVSVDAGGNDCDDASALAYPDGTDTPGDSLDNDCDGWTDGVIRARDDADNWAWDLAELGGGDTDGYDFETYGESDDIAIYGDLSFAGDITALATVYGAEAVGTRGARVLPGTTNTVGIVFADPIDALSLRVLDPDDSFTLVATGPSGYVVSGYTFDLDADDRPQGLYRGFSFAEEVTAITLTGATADGFGLDALEIAWAADSDRDGDGFSDADGDCDDTDADVSPDAIEDLSDGIDNDCDGIVDAGDATAYTDAGAWAAAAALDATSVVDFEAIGEGESVRAQYLDVGVAFDGALVGAGSIDGTSANGTRAARLTSTSTRVVFDEDQPAVALYVLDSDTTLTVDAYEDGVLLYTTRFTPSSASAFYGLTFDVPVDELVLTGADTWGIDDLAYSALGLDDADGDGQTERDGDCDDTDATAYDGATETWYDGVDSDCAEDDDYDADADGAAYPADCDDTDVAVSPDASEIWYDGVDQDCDGLSDYDSDRDGHDDVAFGGDDCDDTDEDVSPDATEVWYDGVDQDCAGDDDDDADGDGFSIDTGFGTLDCDDTNGAINPAAIEVYYDGIDSDCSGDALSDYDADADGFVATAWGGDDCADAEPFAYPGAPGEACYDGVDTDCDGGDDNDCDGDGYASDDHGGDDCDDTTVAVNPAVLDPMGDGLDANCDGGPEYDFDDDGFDGVSEGGADCDDADATVNPAAVDACYDGRDVNCDGWDDDDCDRDGYASDSYGGADCDDTIGAIHPDALDFPYDGIDSDCVGDSEYDRDGDGHTTAFYGGDDCDDTDATAYPGAADPCYDGADSDCGGEDDYDCDLDGEAAAGLGGDDCDDADAAISSSAAEIVGDGVDQDCDGSDSVVCTDCDDDSYDADVDCDDADADVYPGAPDAFYDGVDSDCAGGDEYDADGDGRDAAAWGGGDCDDTDPAVSPDNTVDDCGGGDEDCDGDTDEDCVLSGDTNEDTGTDPRDTGPVLVDTDTRDTAEDWRPGPDSLTEPDLLEREGGCGCDTTGAPLSGLALAVAGLALARRRR